MSFRSGRFGLRTALSDYLLSGKSKTQHSQNITRISADGGTILTPGNGYRYHIFTAPGTLRIGNGGTLDYIAVAGGGGGGGGGSTSSGGGGGGAGGYVSNTNVRFTAGNYNVSVGGGGSQNPPAGRNSVSIGSPTTISGPNITTITASGGGGGGNANVSPTAAFNGGSGGGGASGINPAGTGTAGQGNPGATGGTGNSPTVNAGGGGGGAGAPGTGGSFTIGGPGGNGLPAFNDDTGIPASYGTPGPTPGRYFAGGGGGTKNGTGGSGGGGGGAGPTPGQGGTAGTTNTGGGGGGGNAANGPGGVGGSGIVIVRYLI